MQLFQQFAEQAIAIFFANRASSKGAAKRRGDAGLVGQDFDTDDTPIHVLPGLLLLPVSSAGHDGD